MTALLIDTSVLLKWFAEGDEDEVPQARAIREAHVVGAHDARLLDLALYELSNVLLRRRSWSAVEVADAVDDLVSLLGRVLPISPTWARHGFFLAEQHGLTSYDACWAAAAQHLGVPLVSADRQLLRAGLAESATSVSRRLGLLS
ncbi:MAG: type II toxin-antitoxin system VapC family toxin [Actinomycetota bacterium]|nr:type II toxin-antitoxin system VapC family toxin [Actinomycetota bacterium]